MNLFRPSPRYGHGDLIEIAGARVRLRVNPRARRVSIRLDVARDEIIATAPHQRHLAEAVAFATSRTDWIAQRRSDRPRGEPAQPGMEITIGGRPCVLEAGPGRGRLINDEGRLRLIAPEGERFAATVTRLLKAEARKVLTERTAVHAAALGKPLPAISLGDPKARWGSCSQPRRGGFGGSVRAASIRYSWRLILAPYEVLDYVAAHECAHLAEANHGPDFWALVAQQIPDWKIHRRWLRAHGDSLHAFGRDQ